MLYNKTWRRYDLSIGQVGFVPATNSLLTGIVGYWRLGNTFGSQGPDLTNNNAVTFVSGKLGNAADFVSASSQTLSAADETALRFGNADWTVAFWVNFDSIATNAMRVFGKDDGASNREIAVYQSGGRLNLFLADGSSSVLVLTQSGGAAPGNGVWEFYVVTFTASSGQASIIRYESNGNKTTTSDTVSGAPAAGSAAFRIGGGDSGSYFDGQIDEFGKWSRVLTTAEITLLYNSGAGLTYPFLGAS